MMLMASTSLLSTRCRVGAFVCRVGGRATGPFALTTDNVFATTFRHERPSSFYGGVDARRRFSVGDDDAEGTTTTTRTTTTGESAAKPSPHPLSDRFDASPYAVPSVPDARTDLRVGQRVVALGDVHGDLRALEVFLSAAGVMDPVSKDWVGGDAVLVQCGDVLDRGDDEMACLRLLSSLARKAPETDGSVVLLFGNHEALNAVGMFDYTFDGGNKEIERDVGRPLDEATLAAAGASWWRIPYAGHQPARWAAFEPGGLLAERTLSRFKVAAVVGRSVFVHAGLREEHLRDHGGSLEALNKAATDWISRGVDQPENDAPPTTIDEVVRAANDRLRKQAETMPGCLGGTTASGTPSPVWMRDYSQPADREPRDAPVKRKMIDDALTALSADVGADVRRMVMGHTPQTRINAALGGRAWRVDVGASRGVRGGRPEALEIVHGETEDEIHVLTADGERVRGDQRHVAEYIDFLF